MCRLNPMRRLSRVHLTTLTLTCQLSKPHRPDQTCPPIQIHRLEQASQSSPTRRTAQQSRSARRRSPRGTHARSRTHLIRRISRPVPALSKNPTPSQAPHKKSLRLRPRRPLPLRRASLTPPLTHRRILIMLYPRRLPARKRLINLALPKTRWRRAATIKTIPPSRSLCAECGLVSKSSYARQAHAGGAPYLHEGTTSGRSISHSVFSLGAPHACGAGGCPAVDVPTAHGRSSRGSHIDGLRLQGAQHGRAIRSDPPWRRCTYRAERVLNR